MNQLVQEQSEIIVELKSSVEKLEKAVASFVTESPGIKDFIEQVVATALERQNVKNLKGNISHTNDYYKLYYDDPHQ